MPSVSHSNLEILLNKKGREAYSEVLKLLSLSLISDDPFNELELYLVLNGLKPAARFELDVIACKEKEKIEKAKLARDDKVKSLKLGLDELSLPYSVTNEVKDYMDSIGAYYNLISVYIASNRKNLEMLVNANNDEEEGIALGYPAEAVKAFGNTINGEERNGTYLVNSMQNAENAGISIPSWLAYISFVPEQLDLVSGKISKSSETLGNKYQEFVRANNPELAKRVEARFYKLVSSMRGDNNET